MEILNKLIIPTMALTRICKISLIATVFSTTNAFSTVSTGQKILSSRPSFKNSKHMISLSAASIGMEQNMDLPPGLIKQVAKEGTGPFIRVGDVATVKYTCTVTGSDQNQTPFAKSSAQKFVVGDGLMIDGWEFALQSMRGGERSIVIVTDPKLSYGVAGVPPIVPENAIVEMDMEVLEVEAGVDLGTIASADPLKPVSLQVLKVHCSHY